jgi:hypothetical protein
MAHKQSIPGSQAAVEELTTQAFQRRVRANEQPIVADVDWDRLKREALMLLDGIRGC